MHFKTLSSVETVCKRNAVQPHHILVWKAKKPEVLEEGNGLTSHGQAQMMVVLFPHNKSSLSVHCGREYFHEYVSVNTLMR